MIGHGADLRTARSAGLGPRRPCRRRPRPHRSGLRPGGPRGTPARRHPHRRAAGVAAAARPATAAPLVEATGLTPTTLDWLAEISAPDWDGTPTEEVERIFRENRDRSVDELWDGLPGGESFRDFHVRITTGLEGLLRDRGAATARATPPQWHLPTDERRVVIVAHAGTNATAIGHLLGVAPVPWEWERFALRHASISTLVPLPICGAHAYRLEGLSDVGHLPATLHTY
ncbi:MAG: histidine phosphatase family protein [Acidimicrobiales bacterium]